MATNRVGQITASLTAFVTVLSIGAMTLPNVAERLTLSPNGAIMSSRQPWTVITGCLVELSLLKLAVVLPAILYLGTLAESSFSVIGFVAYLLITTAVSGFAVALATVFLYFITFDTGYLFKDIFGTSGVVMALAIAVFQRDADGHTPTVRGVRVAHAHIPVAILLATPVLEFLFGVTEDTALVCTSMVLSWCFLRFWQPRGDSRGDWRAEFAFARLFPEPFRPPVEAVSVVVHSVARRFWFFREPAIKPPKLPTGVMHQDVEAPPDAPVVVDPVAERRRARALKALNSRIASMDAKGGSRAARLHQPAPATDVGTPSKPPVKPMPPMSPMSPPTGLEPSSDATPRPQA